MNDQQDILEEASSLLQYANVYDEVESLEPLSLGANNRTYRLYTSEKDYVCKVYFRHGNDIRDRLGAEFSFLKYSNAVAPGWAPEAIAMNHKKGIALYEFIIGTPFVPGRIGEKEISAAANYFAKLNDPAIRSKANLSLASEACFSIQENLSLIDGRLKKIEQLNVITTEDSIAFELIKKMQIKWQQIKRWVKKEADASGLDLKDLLEYEERCISASDYGFHNAIRKQDGNICFIDFEYAGWDDPAKMIGDFFSQLAIPVPLKYFDEFVEICSLPFEQDKSFRLRSKLMLPVCQVRWFCIALNVFLPVNLARRRFADPQLNERMLKRKQLEKAIKIFKSMPRSCHGLH